MLQLFKDKTFSRLCLASFFMSSCLQLIWVVMPFVVKSMDGSDTEVGLCFMAQTGIYVFVCILAGIISDRLRPRKVLLNTSFGQVAITCGLVAVIWTGSRLFISPIWQLIFLMSMTGVMTAFYWPVLMGWISVGHEGAELTRRFGLYNVTWGMANMLLPVIGGYLMEINYLSAMGVAAVMMAIGLAAVYFIQGGNEKPQIKHEDQGQDLIEQLNPLNRQFVWISRIALFTMYSCIGIYRSQLGILYKFELGFAESVFGWAVSLMCLTNVVMFYIMGKSHWWHYKKWLIAFSQILIIGCMIVIILSRNMFVQLFAASLTGFSFSIAYSSHQYYCVVGGRKRSGRMAIHEMIIGVGYATGSLGGGLMSDHFGRTWPYIFGSILIAVAGMGQIITWFALKRRNQNSSNADTSFLTSAT